MKLTKLFPLSLICLLAVLLAACGGGETGTSSAVLTEAAVLAAQGLTQTAEAAPPTATATIALPTATNTTLPSATPTITGTPPTATTAPTQQQQSGGSSQRGCLRAELTYETIPDGTQVDIYQTFKKVWTLKNIGTCTWTPAFSLVFQDGEDFGVPGTLPLSDFTEVDIPPGEHLTIDLNLTAPGEQGTYTGYWMLRGSDGTVFGLGPDGRSWFWVEVFVKS